LKTDVAFFKTSSYQGHKNIYRLQFPHLLLSVDALFFYVRVLVIADGSIIKYGQSIGIAMESAKYYTSLTLISLILGYFWVLFYSQVSQKGYFP
jgi:fucose permease